MIPATSNKPLVVLIASLLSSCISAVCRTHVMWPSTGDLKKTHPVSIRPPGSLSGCGDHREAAHDASSLWRSTTSSSEASKRRLERQKKKSERWKQWGIYRRWDLLLVPICERITHFFIIPFYLFILFPNSFLIHLKGETKYQAKRINTVRANG